MIALSILSADSLKSLFQSYIALGPAVAVSAVFFESFLPFLPLSIFVMINAASFGMINGLLFSFAGCIAGNWVIYAISRYFGSKPFFLNFKQKPGMTKYFRWLDDKGALYTALLCLLPGFPNTFVSIAAGMNRMNFKAFALSSAFGTMGLMIFFSMIGTDITGILKSPLKITSVCLLFISVYLIGKIAERKQTLRG